MGTMKDNNQMQFGRMPGAIVTEDRICFRAVVRGGDFCRLLLFHKGAEAPSATVPMERIGTTNVFYTELPKDSSYATYLYEDARGVFTDPFARALCGRSVFGVHTEEAAVLPHENTGSMESAGFQSPAFSSLIFYKVHVRGFTKHATSGVKHKGTYLGMQEKIPYLKELGINAVLFMPVYEFDECMKEGKAHGILPASVMAEYEKRYGSDFVKAQEAYEKEQSTSEAKEKVNYWGYTEQNFYFAPKAAYAADPSNAEQELKALVDALHKAGISVFFEMFFGAETKQLILLDCLRFWTEQYHADGFRLIGEKLPMQLILEDVYLSGVKFLVGNTDGVAFSDGSYENRRLAVYNDEFRTVARRFVKGDENMIWTLVDRMCTDREEAADIHFIADQNGFSLYDIYAYDRKHNEANGEDNKDGEDYNYSWNCGVEGENSKKKLVSLRAKLRKNAICTVLLSQSVPLIFAGDEIAHTKKGNNNAYCQDNEVSWLNWRLNKDRKEHLDFVKQLIAFRKNHKALCGGRRLRQEDYKGLGLPELSYHGVTLWQPDFAPYSRSGAVLYSGAYAADNEQEDIYILYNMHWEKHVFSLPQSESEDTLWQIALDTSLAAELCRKEDYKAIAETSTVVCTEQECTVMERSVVVLTRKSSKSKERIQK